MNCAECRDNLAAWVEGLLDPEQSLQCRSHLESCPACRLECAAITRLQERLIAHGQSAVDVSLVDPVLRQIRNEQLKRERTSLMSRVWTRWGFGIGAIAGAAAVFFVALVGLPKAHATPAQIMAKGAAAVNRLISIHMKGQLRTLPADNFSYIDPNQDFANIEIWKEFDAPGKWRVDKPGRIAVMDGNSTLLWIKAGNTALKTGPAANAFDTLWFHKMADLNGTLTSEIAAVKAHNWPITLTEEKGGNGASKSVVTVIASSGLPDSDYLKNTFFDTADTRRVYTFDNQSELLESVKVFLRSVDGEKLICEVGQIEYNQQLDPALFVVELPADVNWFKEPQKAAGDEKYTGLTPEQTARAFFEACGRGDWGVAEKFWPGSLDERIRGYLKGLQVVNIGKAFTSGASSANFVPYEIKFANGEVKKWNLALKKNQNVDRWIFDGGL